MYHNFKNKVFLLVFCCTVSCICMTVSATTTELHIVKYAMDNTTVLAEKTITYQWMETNLPVMGDGITHYYHQGPVFVDDADPSREEELRLNRAEDTNVQEKDMGAVKGTTIKDICDLVGGMSAGDEVTIKADDGFTKTFAYENVYTPSSRQGPMVITWYQAGVGYVPAYREGMRLVFFADNSTNPWGIHAFGAADWHETANPKYWYYYQQGTQRYPTTTGLSIQDVSEVWIYSRSTARQDPVLSAPTTPAAMPTKAGLSLLTIAGSLAIGSAAGLIITKRV